MSLGCTAKPISPTIASKKATKSDAINGNNPAIPNAVIIGFVVMSISCFNKLDTKHGENWFCCYALAKLLGLIDQPHQLIQFHSLSAL